MNQTPPGWYHAAGDPANTKRYWDGSLWQGEPVAGEPQAGFSTANPSGGGGNLLGQRIGAKIIDGLIIMIPLAIILVVIAGSSIDFGILSDTTLSEAEREIQFEAQLTELGEDTTFNLFSRFGFPLLVTAYYFITYSSMGASLGKKATKIKIAGTSESGLETAEVAKRVGIHALPYFLIGLLPLPGFILGLLSLYYFIAQPIMAATGTFKTLRDKFSGTRVVRA